MRRTFKEIPEDKKSPSEPPPISCKLHGRLKVWNARRMIQFCPECQKTTLKKRRQI